MSIRSSLCATKVRSRREFKLQSSIELVLSASETCMTVVRMNAWLWAAIAWIGLIFFSSTTVAGESSEEAFSVLSRLLVKHLQPGTSSYDLVHLLADKSVHVALFFIFAILLWRALPNAPGKVVSILVAGAVIGSCSELLQFLFPGRDPAIRDVLINTGSTALGLAFSFVISKCRPTPIQDRSAPAGTAESHYGHDYHKLERK